ncbi:MAG TPA: hypothetical protein VL422_10965 [Miltoncostaea sp.]|nr:hypothetical protein [Miltoncostaea sp.]
MDRVHSNLALLRSPRDAETRDGRAAADRRPGRAFPPILAAAALLGLRIAAAPFGDPGWRTAAVVVHGSLALAAVAHVAAMRWPRRYAVNGLSWVLTIVALIAAVSLILAGDGR